MAETKSFGISKEAVWKAWLLVRANQGAGGVDDESIASFEKKLKPNLYKIWNRMSSGAYFPPPVRTVKIPKPDGRGELDWIVMRALEKDRNRRYETASSFAADLQRYLQDEPVQACPPSVAYRFRKFARRNRMALGTATAVALVGLLGVAGLATSTVLIRQEQQATANALQAEIQAKADLEQALERERLNSERERLNSYYQRIALAEQEWSANNLLRMQQLLDDCPEDLRGWE